MGSKFFEELSRCLGKEQIESLSKEDRRLEIFLHHLLAEDPNLNDKQIRAIQEARIKIEFSVPDLDTQLEHRQDYSPQMEM